MDPIKILIVVVLFAMFILLMVAWYNGLITPHGVGK
jgi:hypothetical protein